jgi:ACS family hexuronate transporter-like MFS transporter
LGLGEPATGLPPPRPSPNGFSGAARLGIGLFNAGSSLGSAIAPPLVAFLTLHFGWRAAFLATGALGFVWLIAHCTYQPPHLSRFITPRE